MIEKNRKKHEEKGRKKAEKNMSEQDREELKAGRREKSKPEREENFEKSIACKENTPEKPETKPKIRIENKSQKVSKKPCKNRKGRL